MIARIKFALEFKNVIHLATHVDFMVRDPLYSSARLRAEATQNKDQSNAYLYVLRLESSFGKRVTPFAASCHGHNSFAVNSPCEVPEGCAGETDDVYPSSAHRHDQQQRYENAGLDL